MMEIVKEFKEFAMRGNVLDMAVGVIMGGAFGKIISSIVSDIIMPPIGLLIGGVNFTDLKITLKHVATDATGHVVPAVTLNYGNFLQTTLNFLIIAFSIFLFIKGINTVYKRHVIETTMAKATPSNEEILLTEIRDLLKEQKHPSQN